MCRIDFNADIFRFLVEALFSAASRSEAFLDIIHNRRTPMKNHHFAMVALIGMLMISCEKSAERRTDDTGSPATEASPSVPVPKPDTLRNPEVKADDAKDQ
jgi:hypothetical protein